MKRLHGPFDVQPLRARSLILILTVMLVVTPASAHAQSADWSATSVTTSANRIFILGDGTLLVQTIANTLLRSDDGAQTFRDVPLPAPSGADAGPRPIAIDPADASVVYAASDAGLTRTLDGGATFQVIFAAPIAAVSASPADPRLVYIGVPGPGSNQFRFLRSEDGGDTFAVIAQLESDNPECVFDVSLLQADQSQVGRVFRSTACLAGRDLASPGFSQALERSVDGGQTFGTVARPAGGFAALLVGGTGVLPARYYLADTKPFSATPSAVYRSDDGAASFTQVFQLPPLAASSSQPIIGGLAFDPNRPERVFVGQRNGATGVVVSEDGGGTFTPLGRRNIGQVFGLALAGNGSELYAATSQGLFHLSFSGSSPPPVQIPVVLGPVD
ncbi:MAG: WD40/YVTN/BNR-like repeat-containing protein [Chloroflexota bacterium]